MSPFLLLLLAPCSFSAVVPSAPLVRSTRVHLPPIKLSAEPDDSPALGAVGAVGIVSSVVSLVSEAKLKTTGCGLPAGPFGIYGAVEGISYLVVTGLVIASVVEKVRTGRGLRPGPFGLLGAAEGLAFLAVVIGIAVAGFTVIEYGDLPNAVPVEGGRCS